MIVNRDTLLSLVPIVDMLSTKETSHGVSYGMSEAGYDIRIKQDVIFRPKGCLIRDTGGYAKDTEVLVRCPSYPAHHGYRDALGRFTLASSIEKFQMTDNLVGIVHDKSTWARRGLSVFNTVIEPGWSGFLTLELVYHGNDELIIPAGSGIAQVVFHNTTDTALYSGKYQNQEDRPVEARKSI